MSSTELKPKIASDALVETTYLAYGLYSMRRFKIAQKVGKKIRVIRRKKKLTQEEVAARTDIHITTFGRIERGEINTNLQTLNKIAQALGVKPKDFLP